MDIAAAPAAVPCAPTAPRSLLMAKKQAAPARVKTTPRNPVVGIAWDGLPFYAARLLREAATTPGIDLRVIGLGAPPHPKSEIEAAFGGEIAWAERHDDDISWRSLIGEVPALGITSGWWSQSSLRLARQVKAQGGQVCLMADNRWQGSLRQLVSPLVFSRRFAPLFDYAWVPGKSAAGFMQYLGFPSSRILTGLYGADAGIFTPGSPPSGRPRKFVFAGQLVHRKGVDILLKAFRNSGAHEKGWTLDIFGEGELAGHLSLPPGVRAEGFVSSAAFAESLRQSRCLILPSRHDNWGVVVHEAACAGCAVIVSDTVGAADDLATQENGHVFDSGSAAALTRALKAVQRWSVRDWDDAGAASLRLARKFGPEKWAATFAALCKMADVLQPAGGRG